jgi:asparagine synthase (glutamine-hydrolysing)
MSIQAGLWNFDGQPADRTFLECTSRMLAEYAPDGESIHVEQSVGMLYRPRHTTGKSKLEHQPCHLSRGGLMTWDGRLDNRDELINLLSDVKKDQPDAEIVAAAFNHWGTDAFARLLGDWSLVIFNPATRELVLAKDFMGTRSLFYHPKPQQIVWCTHLGTLVLNSEKLTLCEDYIAGFLASHPDAELTPYREIHSVPPASFVSINPRKTTVHCYWRVEPRRTAYKTDREYEEHYRHLLHRAVQRRLRSSSPVLAELSGGLDSSSIVLMADDIRAKAGAEAPEFETLSYHDSCEPEDDDFAYISALEQTRGKKGIRLDLAGAGDSFSLDYTAFAGCPGFGVRKELQSPLQDLIRHSACKVILSGLGGDEINGQTLSVPVLVADRLLRLEIVQACKELIDWSLQTRRPWIQLFFRSVVATLPTPLNIRLRDANHKLKWIEPAFATEYHVAARHFHATNEPWLAAPAVRDWRQTITSLRNAIALAGPSIVEKRYPYLDRELVGFVTSIPLDQLLRPGQRRSLMRRALCELLPQEILLRKTKGTAVRCFCATLLKHWSKIDTILASPLSSRLSYINRDHFYAALLAMRNGQVPGSSVALFRALSLELWLRDAKARGIFSTPAALSVAS